MSGRRTSAAAAVVGVAIVAYVGFVRDRHLNWGATIDEASRELPGDQLMPDADVVATRVVEIDAPAADVWPWLVQMGPGRGGAYTYDWIERRLGVDIHNTDRIVPELQHLAVGDEIPMTGYTMRAEIVDPQRTLGFRSSDGKWAWSFELVPTDGHTRLISRNRFNTSAYTLKDWAGYAVMEPGSWVMERKMLLTIKQRAEALAKRATARTA